MTNAPETLSELPTGTVTFLFTDIEGSTRLIQTLGEEWKTVLEEHNRLVGHAIRESGGRSLRTEGDAFFAVFRTAPEAVAAASAAQRALAGHGWPEKAMVRIRIGMHTGEGTVGGDDYIGLDVHRAARIAAAGHGGQVLLSSATSELVRSQLPDGVDLRDLGLHRLKDLARPERVLQLVIDGLPAEFPPIRSLETPTNLPTQRTTFVGRKREVARVKASLRGPGLLTLTGPGGSGKTRLALQAASELLEHYRDGDFLVELAAITDPLLLPSTIVDAIGVRAEGVRPVLDTLKDHLRSRELLLILDNFEQVIDAASTVADLITAPTGLRMLVTSREPLHLRGEHEFAVPPLQVPDVRDPPTPKSLRRNESVALFVRRARAVDAGFRLTEANSPAVAELCRRLDGLPLAIELAASRVKVLSPEAILERIEHRLELLTTGPVDVPARQRTLREAIAWSYDLLDTPERAVFRRLSVFAGGSTLESAEAVTNPGDQMGGGILGIIGSLIDKSLVERAPTESEAIRFGMLETIREYAGERLEEAGEAGPTRDRHLAHFLDLAEDAEPHLRGVDQKWWLDQLEVEHDNLRAALRRAIDSGHHDLALRLAGALWRFWHLHGHLDEGRRWAEEVLTLPGTAGRTAYRARALTALGGVAYWQEDLSTTDAAYQEALAIAREIGGEVAEAEGLYNLSFVPAYQGNFKRAVAMVKESQTMFEEMGMRRGVADTVWLLAIVARLEGDNSTARARAEESLAIHREIGDRFGMTDALHVLGRIALADGDVVTAGASFLEALSNDEVVGNQTGMGIVLDNLAAIASAEGKHLRAVRLGGASEAIKEAAGGHAPPPFIDLPDPREAARKSLGDAAIAAAWEEGRAMTLDQALAYAREEN